MKQQNATRTLLRLMMIAAIFLSVFLIARTSAHAASPTYKIKVNTKKCVTTVYQKVDGKWKPIRCMYCAPGKPSTPTPLGTYTLKGRWPWYHMTGPDYNVQVRYAIQVHGDYFMHSCCYSSIDKTKESKPNFNGLGHGKTHGCIRFSVMDAKWIYENCEAGTEVTFYRSDKTGPLGKPEKKLKMTTKSSRGWDPTDPDKKNPSFKMKGATFTISDKKLKEMKCGKTGKNADLMYGVTAVNPYANQDLTDQIKIQSLTLNGKKIKPSKYSTKTPGKYKVTYYVRDKYCTQEGKDGKTKSFTFKIMDKTSIKIKNPKRTVHKGDVNAVKGVRVTARSGDRTKDLRIKIVTPSGKTKRGSYNKAKNFIFRKAGDYKITYSIQNAYPKKTVKKTITIRSLEEEPADTAETSDSESAA